MEKNTWEKIPPKSRMDKLLQRDLNFQLLSVQEERLAAERASSYRSFQISAASYAKLRAKCVTALYGNEAKCWTSSITHHRLDFCEYHKHYV